MSWGSGCWRITGRAREGPAVTLVKQDNHPSACHLPTQNHNAAADYAAGHAGSAPSGLDKVLCDNAASGKVRVSCVDELTSSTKT